MRILFALNHPAHYYLFKFASKDLEKKGHQVRYVIKGKDILEEILKNENVSFTKLISRRKRKKNLFSTISNLGLEMLKQDISLQKYLKTFLPVIMIGTDISISHVGKMKGIPAIIFNEDDIEINKLFCYASYPFASQVVTPEICNVGPFKEKRTGYNGYQKLAYLHPNWFKPDIGIVRKYFRNEKPYFLIRLVSFTAGHDIEKKHGGISRELMKELILLLEQKGKVCITSEEKLPVEFERYKLNIDLTDIHQMMYFSDLFIGDSQSMIVEAAMLGVPSVRFNSFAGKISVLNELEERYNLTTGISNNNREFLLHTIKKLLETENLRNIYQKRREKMLSEKIDVTAFMVWFIENYPASVKIMKEDPDYQLRFR
jgi:uncharacterized protein